MPTIRCPSCRVEVKTKPENPSFPFCSQRCRSVDLGRWLNEEYRFVVASADEDEDGDASATPRRREDA